MNFNEIKNWWPKTGVLSEHPIAYFCAEFALSDELPIYSGGLGVLAGDVIREAAADRIPLVGIGLFYKEGYFRQVITEAGLQDEFPAYHELSKLPIAPVLDQAGQELHIKLSIADRIIVARAWRYTEGSVPVYLLDTDLPENQNLDRRLTLSLYPTDNEWRIQQEIVLGIGGARLLEALGITPSVYHLNEGHSAFAVLEVAYQHVRTDAISFAEALRLACSRIVFTNHTLISSGNDVFSSDLIAHLLGEYANNLQLPIDQVLRMGTPPGQPGNFSMTHLALTASRTISAVSKSHAQFAQVTWPDSTLTPITNGVHVPYWQAPQWRDIASRLQRGFEVRDTEVWRTHLECKIQLLEHIARATGYNLSPETLTITWARRIAAYKQPLLLFSDVVRLKAIVTNATQPIQIILAGKAHPSDITAKAMISELLGILKTNGLENFVVFVPNYNLSLAKLLVAGSDVWLNTPIKGQEACGTSGMKSAINGGLQCAISDGWTDEIPLHELGFSLSPVDSANSLYTALEQTIAPIYYQGRGSDGIPIEWTRRMQSTIAIVSRDFSSERMVREYIEHLYLKALG